MARKVRLGLLTPSSNTILEPLTSEMLADAPGVSAHFSRFRVMEISMRKEALEQFDFTPQLLAAELLSDAKADVIAWAGTSGGWVGPAKDEALAVQLQKRTGVPATTSTLALIAAFRALRVKRYALVTPYLDDVQDAIIGNFGKLGFECIAERHLGDKGNYSFCEYGENEIAEMVRAVAPSRPDAVAIYCTNFIGTRIAAALERELDIPILDSIAFTVWHMMCKAQADMSAMSKWGRLFTHGATH